jgi:type III pantothenate kinase
MNTRTTADPPSLLAADVGNTRIKYGWFEPELAEASGAWPVCRQFAVTSLDAPVPVEQLQSWSFDANPWLIIAGSNPQVVHRIGEEWRQAGHRAWTLRDRQRLPLALTVEAPETVGLDRLLNAVAANALRPPERPAIIVDSGTATTVDVITQRGEFAGGAILPGLALSAQALHYYTALLPLLTLADLGPDLPEPLGRNTREALRSGIYWGQVGAIRQLVESMSQAFGAFEPWLILTGGGAPWLSARFPGVRQLPSLAVHGLVLTAWTQRLE